MNHYGHTITPHHLSGDNLTIKLFSTETYPIGVALQHFSNDVEALPPTEKDVQSVTTLNVIGDSVEVESYHGIYVAIHVEPGSREAHNIEVLLDLSARRMSGPEAIHAFVEYANGDCYVYSGGVILCGKSSKVNSAYFFHFRKLKRITPEVFKAMRGDLLAMA